MFTGIIEEVALLQEIKKEQGNLHLTVKARFTPELKIDQSVAHNGVCLTVVALDDETFTVTAIQETLEKTNLEQLNVGDEINLERGLQLPARLDGHIVQGHVDGVGICTEIIPQDGSTIFTFSYNYKNIPHVTIEKGSITINGVSLTVINSKNNSFSVAIIPYTLAHTTFKNLKQGDTVNLEFDVIGKYVQRLAQF
ncbi:riboflavin synthase [Mesonia hippocampi]|uniref:Riboflavin synthase n=1 Tax=Mesonia hippocampi TaxID=1628250 RepID=A0A840EGU6_9FLAO|nr:riboflavin synthase [Mesonia hippocampi]MBB4118492.1 riboflavin synthase [Mesonia hippocampi]